MSATISVGDSTVTEGDDGVGFLGEFVASGTGGVRPLGVTVGPDGDVYVANSLGDSVIRYDGTTGIFKDTFVSPMSGGLRDPHSVVFGPDGNLYVTSLRTGQVLRYNGTTGEFLGVFVSADRANKMSSPTGMVFGPDATGDGYQELYISSSGNNMVVRVNGKTGKYLNTFVPTGSGGLDGPYGLTFGPDGNLYVSSSRTDQVLRYSGTTGAFIDAFVAAGSGGLDNPYDVLFTPDGHLYVTSPGTNQFFLFGAKGDVLRYDGSSGAFDSVFATGGLRYPTGLALRDGKLLVSSMSSYDVRRYDLTSGVEEPFVRRNTPVFRPVGLTFGPDGDLYVASHDGENVMRFDGQTGASKGKFVDVYSPTEVHAPNRVVFGPDGNGDGAQDLYLSSAYTNEILRYDGLNGTFIDSFVTQGSGGLDFPDDFLFTPDGNYLYVSSGNTDQVLRYDGRSGAFIDVLVGAGSGGLDSPRGLTFGLDGSDLYVCSLSTSQVLRYNAVTGAFLGVFVAAGNGGLVYPNSAVFGPDGNLYVATGRYEMGGTQEVLRYDGQSGAFLDVYVAAHSGGLTDPQDLVFDAAGNLYVTGWRSNDVLRYGRLSQTRFSVSLSERSPWAVTVDVVTADGTATATSDYQGISPPRTLIFTPNDVGPRTVLVETIDDNVVESTEQFFVNLSNAVGATIADGQGVGTILNDDLPPLPSLSINDVSQAEGNSGTTIFTFTVTRSGDASSAVTVAYATANGTAKAPGDYKSTTGSLTFAANVMTRTVNVSVVGETKVEPNETFFVNLSNPVGATIADGQGVGTIVNDDGTAALTSGALSGGQSVPVANTGGVSSTATGSSSQKNAASAAGTTSISTAIPPANTALQLNVVDAALGELGFSKPDQQDPAGDAATFLNPGLEDVLRELSLDL